MNILVIGKGGREHALVWKLKQSPRADRVFCAPGNAGTSGEGAVNVAIESFEMDRLARFCTKEQVGLVVIGPEDPLAAGLSDFLRQRGIKVFGPSKEAARIEASKVFSKELMRHADVPTAEFQIFDHPEPARAHIESRDYPVVVKADGLAAGKGVVVCKSSAEAIQAVRRIMTEAEFGEKAGRQIVVEKKLEGEEVSVLALVSGRTFLLLPACQDHKAVNDGDKGPNTGGMGTYCPAPAATPQLLAELERDVFFPIIHTMKRGRFPFQGVLFAGIMLTNQGPRVLEFNCRFGDPETQPILMRLKSDLVDLLEAVVDERLHEFEDKVVWDPRPAVCVVMCSGGYPGKYAAGKPILGIEEAEKLPDVKVFHAGTKIDERGRLVTDGGRVLGVTALGDDLAAAKARAYEAVQRISFSGMHYRTDIADKALRRKPPAAPPEPPKLPAKFKKRADPGKKPAEVFSNQIRPADNEHVERKTAEVAVTATRIPPVEVLTVPAPLTIESPRPRGTIWCANFDALDVLEHGLGEAMWLMQYQYSHDGYEYQGLPTNLAMTTTNWGVLCNVKKGDTLIAYLPGRAGNSGSTFYAIGEVTEPRVRERQKDARIHLDSVARTTADRSHLYLDGIVRYADSEVLYEDYSDSWTTPAGSYGNQPPVWRYPQRIDVRQWTDVVAEGVVVPGLEDAAKRVNAFIRRALFPLPEDFYQTVRAALRNQGR